MALVSIFKAVGVVGAVVSAMEVEESVDRRECVP